MVNEPNDTVDENPESETPGRGTSPDVMFTVVAGITNVGPVRLKAGGWYVAEHP